MSWLLSKVVNKEDYLKLKSPTVFASSSTSSKVAITSVPPKIDCEELPAKKRSLETVNQRIAKVNFNPIFGCSLFHFHFDQKSNSRQSNFSLDDTDSHDEAADILNDRVLPFFEENGIPLLRILTDRGTEFKGKPEHHEYELYLSLEGIDHSKTQVRHPQTNGICERLHRTMQEEFYAIAFRKKLYDNLELLQKDLDTWMEYYNNERPHSGRYCFGKTPMQTFSESLTLAKDKILNQNVDQNILTL
jgi:hypothetical protein